MTTTVATTAAPVSVAALATTTAPARRSVVRTGAVAGVAASAATAAFAAGARAIDIPLRVGGQPIPALGFAQVTLVASIIGVVLAVVLARRAHHPQRTFVVTTLALTLVSFAPDVLADATTATRLALALSHVVAAAILIPALAARLDA